MGIDVHLKVKQFNRQFNVIRHILRLFLLTFNKCFYKLESLRSKLVFSYYSKGNWKLNRIITITGDLGSGKSIVSELIGRKIGFRVVSMGSVQREIAAKHKMTTLELNKYAEGHQEIDSEIDSVFQQLKAFQNLVVDSRMAWFFLPSSFKVNLICNRTIAAERIFADSTRKNEPKYGSLEEAIKDLEVRKRSENNRFRNTYGVDCRKLDNFDLVVDTSYAIPEEIAAFIVQKFNEWFNGSVINQCWLSPKMLFPTQSIRSLAGDYTENIIRSIRGKGFDNSEPIEVVFDGENYFIWDGHKRTSAAIFCQFNLIPVKIVAKDQDDILPGLSVTKFLDSGFELKWVYDWEDCHGFRYKSPPRPYRK